ncbi:MAG: SRPBCC family protein [Acidimicrobiia bacterium]|jgi:hypothetical protein
MSMDVRLCVVIDAAPAAVWAEVGRIERHVEWMADAESIAFVGEQRSGAGTEFECRTRVGPLRTTDVMRVTEWEPERVMGIVHRGLFTGTGRFTLQEATGGRTRFCWDERIRFPWRTGGPVGERAARPMLTRVWRRNLRALKALVEGA